MRIIAGSARGRSIRAPEGRDTRPTLDRVRENLFNMLQTEVPGSRVLDLFAGSGALSLEALSRGAAFAVLTDHDRRAVQTQRENISALGFAEQTRVMQADWREAVRRLQTEGERFDLVFLDPPYAMTDLRDVLKALRNLLQEDALVVVEHRSGERPVTPESFALERERSWGYCGVTFYRPDTGNTEKC